MQYTHTYYIVDGRIMNGPSKVVDNQNSFIMKCKLDESEITFLPPEPYSCPVRSVVDPQLDHPELNRRRRTS